MSADAPLDSAAIRRAVERVVPIGSPSDSVAAYLTLHGFVQDSSKVEGGNGALSQFHWFQGRSKLIANVLSDGSDLTAGAHWSVNIGFDFDSSQHLVRVGVYEALTGM
jgi:hypothetical protein